MIFSAYTPEDSSSRRKRWVSDGIAFVLTLAATGVMMLCPCDTVGIHDYGAISLVGVATAIGVAAAAVAYRRMSRTSGKIGGTTGFLRAVIALAVVWVAIFIELSVAMEVVALMARRQ